jgi:hypothetical protein
MSEELQGKLVEVITSIQGAVGKASDFALGQLPDVAQSYVVYGRVTATLDVVVLGAMFAGAVYVAVRKGFLNHTAIKTRCYSEGDWEETRTAAAVVGSMAAVILFCCEMAAIQSAALVWFAPKVWLLKELAALVK